MTKASTIIESRILDLREAGFESLILPCVNLLEAIGDAELDHDAERILRWLLNWDPDVIGGIASILRAAKAQQRFDILTRAVGTSSIVAP